MVFSSDHPSPDYFQIAIFEIFYPFHIRITDTGRLISSASFISSFLVLTVMSLRFFMRPFISLVSLLWLLLATVPLTWSTDSFTLVFHLFPLYHSLHSSWRFEYMFWIFRVNLSALSLIVMVLGSSFSLSRLKPTLG